MPRTMCPMSVSIDPKDKELIEQKAEKRGMNTSEFIRWIIFDNFAICDEDVIPVVFKIPKEATLDRDVLGKWLRIRMNVVANKLSNGTN